MDKNRDMFPNGQGSTQRLRTASAGGACCYSVNMALPIVETSSRSSRT